MSSQPTDWKGGRINEQTDKQTNRQTDKRTNGRTDERTNGQTDERTNLPQPRKQEDPRGDGAVKPVVRKNDVLQLDHAADGFWEGTAQLVRAQAQQPQHLQVAEFRREPALANQSINQPTNHHIHASHHP